MQVVYSELLFTTRPYMKHVCAIEYEWIERLVSKLKNADPRLLTGRLAGSSEVGRGEGG